MWLLPPAGRQGRNGNVARASDARFTASNKQSFEEILGNDGDLIVRVHSIGGPWARKGSFNREL
jgi:hypothetical protein